MFFFSHISLLRSCKAIFHHKNVSVQSAPAVFVLPRLPIYDKTVIVFGHTCKWISGGWGSQPYLLINEHFILIAFEMPSMTFYIGKCKIGLFCTGLPCMTYTRASPHSTALPDQFSFPFSLATFDAKSHKINIKICKKFITSPHPLFTSLYQANGWAWFCWLGTGYLLTYLHSGLLPKPQAHGCIMPMKPHQTTV